LLLLLLLLLLLRPPLSPGCRRPRPPRCLLPPPAGSPPRTDVTPQTLGTAVTPHARVSGQNEPQTCSAAPKPSGRTPCSAQPCRTNSCWRHKGTKPWKLGFPWKPQLGPKASPAASESRDVTAPPWLRFIPCHSKGFQGSPGRRRKRKKPVPGGKREKALSPQTWRCFQSKRLPHPCFHSSRREVGK
uniref:Uncharacterized protein n=1 Tax=Junco hyemalis TaxID=40217 RepID=A0A8C5IHD7_JUNHY